MSFEPLKLKLVDRKGREVDDSVRTIVLQAFEKAVRIPDAKIEVLVSGAARVARVIADGRATKPEAYAASVLGAIARISQREFEAQPFGELSESDVELLESGRDSPSSILATIEIRQLLDGLEARDEKIVTMRGHGFRYDQIAKELRMLEVSVRCRFHLAKRRLRKRAGV